MIVREHVMLCAVTRYKAKWQEQGPGTETYEVTGRSAVGVALVRAITACRLGFNETWTKEAGPLIR